MRIESIEAIRNLMLRALEIRKIPSNEARLIVNDFLDAQIQGKITHGIGKFLLIDSALAERRGSPKVVKNTKTWAIVDGNRELGQIAAYYCLDLLKNKAKQHGIAMVGMKNTSRYGRLYPYGKSIAEANLVGIVMNNAGPPAVTPHNGIDPIMGTNPICFAFPGREREFVFDFSTSKHVWGEIRQATLEKRKLPSDSFLNKNGHFTTNPDMAEAVLPFGEVKGYAMCLAVEIIAGALVGAKMGFDVKTQYDLGFLFIAINPTCFTDIDAFINGVESLATSIRSSRPLNSDEPVRVPGDSSSFILRQAERSDEIQVDEETYTRLEAMSRSLNGGIETTDKLD